MEVRPEKGNQRQGKDKALQPQALRAWSCRFDWLLWFSHLAMFTGDFFTTKQAVGADHQAPPP